jgi:hypothetical protein
VKRLLLFLFGCPHRKIAFPITMKIGHEKRTYRICLVCGAELAYDAERMEFL